MFAYAALLKYGIILLVITGFAGGAFYYYTSTQNQLQEYAAEAAIQEIQMVQQENIIEQQEEDLILQQDLVVEINEKFETSRNQVETLRRKFNKVNGLLGQRDLGKLAIAKPKLIEKIINKGTKNAQRCIEIASGSPLTDKELSAMKKSEINDACTAIANPNFILY